MPKIDLPYRGVSDATGEAVQPPGTTGAAENVCGINPRDGRGQMIVQREGQDPFIAGDPDVSSDSVFEPINFLGSVVYSDRGVTWSQNTTATVDWSSRLRSLTAAVAIKRDAGGNQYVLDEKNVVTKKNPDGGVVYTLNLPVGDPLHKCRALAADSFGNWYAAVSEGGEQSKAKLWRYRHNEDGQILVEWSLDLGMYCERIALDQDRGAMYLTLNDTLRNESWVARYDGVDVATPSESWRSKVASPARGLSLYNDGSVVFCSPPNANRNLNPAYPSASPISEAADYKDVLVGFEDRAWAWWRPYLTETLIKVDLDGTLLNTPVEKDGDAVGVMLDSRDGRVDQGRHWWAGYYGDTGGTMEHQKAPRYKKNGYAGRPCLQFNSTDPAFQDPDLSQFMSSGRGTSVKYAQRDTSRQAFPGYRHTSTNGSAYAVLAVIRPQVEQESPATSALPGIVWSVHNNRPSQGGRPRLEANYDFYVTGDQAQNGYISGKTASNAANERSVDFQNTSDAIIVLYVFDGFNPASQDASPEQYSAVRINGTAVQNGGTGKWITSASNQRNENLSAAYLGGIPAGIEGTTLDNVNEVAKFYRGEVYEMLVLNDSLYTPNVEGGRHRVLDGDLDSSTVDSEVTKIEGVAAHRHGLQHLLPSNHPYRNYPPTKAGAPFLQATHLFTNTYGLMGKLDSAGAYKWVHPASVGVTPQGGVGYDVIVDPTEAANGSTRIFSVGPKASDTPGNNAIVTSFVDVGGTSAGSPTVLAGEDIDAGVGVDYADWLYAYPQLDVDKFSQIYVPWAVEVLADNASMKVLSSGLATVASWSNDTVTIGNRVYAQCCAADPLVPEYSPDVITIAETCAVGLADQSPVADVVLYNLRFAAFDVTSSNPRATKNIAVTGGDLYTFDQSALSSAVATGVFSTTGYIHGISAFGKFYMTDGSVYKVYDPIANTLSTWSSTTAGRIPPRCKLLALFNGRIVMSRDPEGRTYMSARGNPEDFDTAPQVPTVDQAVAYSQLAIGEVPDAVNALVVLTDDLMLFGCEKSIYRQTGDPMLGGVIDLVTNRHGMAFGRAHTMDDRGNLYYLGSPGGVYMMRSDMTSERISRTGDIDVERRLEGLANARMRIEFVWNDAQECLYIFAYPWGYLNDSGGSLLTSETLHFKWERRTGAWWPMTFGDFDVVPSTATRIESGDVLVASGGKVRFMSRSANDDVGVAISSSVRFGPLALEESERLNLVSMQSLLTRNRQGVTAVVTATDNPNDTDTSPWIGSLPAGRSMEQSVRKHGSFVYVTLNNITPNSSWALETFWVEMADAGKARG